jgi:hypothetical protein
MHMNFGTEVARKHTYEFCMNIVFLISGYRCVIAEECLGYI